MPERGSGGACEAPSGAAGGAVPAAWWVASAEVLERIDDPALPEVLARALGTLVRFEHTVGFVYRSRGGPIHIHDTLPRAQAGIRNYVRSTYALNPVYHAYRDGLKTGVYRLRDLASKARLETADLSKFRLQPSGGEEIGYLTDGWPAEQEELSIAVELPDGEFVDLTISRRAGGGFTDAEIAHLTAVTPFLAAALRRYWQRVRWTYLGRQSLQAADRFALHRRLSRRERELAQLLLCGHSTPSAAARLGIGPNTVKTHRKNLYAKLGVDSQAEFFALFVQPGADTLG